MELQQTFTVPVPVALGDQLLDVNLERVERRRLLADAVERRAGLAGLHG